MKKEDIVIFSQTGFHARDVSCDVCWSLDRVGMGEEEEIMTSLLLSHFFFFFFFFAGEVDHDQMPHSTKCIKYI